MGYCAHPSPTQYKIYVLLKGQWHNPACNEQENEGKLCWAWSWAHFNIYNFAFLHSFKFFQGKRLILFFIQHYNSFSQHCVKIHFFWTLVPKSSNINHWHVCQRSQSKRVPNKSQNCFTNLYDIVMYSRNAGMFCD